MLEGKIRNEEIKEATSFGDLSAHDAGFIASEAGLSSTAQEGAHKSSVITYSSLGCFPCKIVIGSQ